MIIKMKFTLKNGIEMIVELPYDDDTMRKCRKKIITKCEKWLFLEGVPHDKQDKV